MLTILVLACCIQSISSDILLCSDYLISGLHGVNDSALTASSSYTGYVDYDFGPSNARLYYPGDSSSTPARTGGWAPGTVDFNGNAYIQVTFSQLTIVKSLTIQGRYAIDDRWVKTFYLQYSIDGVTWASVTSQDDSPQLFTGNSDMNTPVTSTISPNIEVISLRIIPASWHFYPVLRFDVGGCQERRINNGHSKFARKSAALSEEMVSSHTVIASMSVPTFRDCAFTCRDHVTCMAFSYKTDNGINWCKGFSAWIVNPGKLSSSNEAVFISQGILDSYGYREEQGGSFLYSVIEVRKDQISASATCRAQYTRLFRIVSESKMASLKNIISGNNIFRNNYKFYVSGRYQSPKWMYDGGTDEIDNILWAPDNPNPDLGHCVMLTEAGLASVDCADKLYSLCGH